MFVYQVRNDDIWATRWLLQGDFNDRFAILRSGQLVNRSWKIWDMGCPFFDY